MLDQSEFNDTRQDLIEDLFDEIVAYVELPDEILQHCTCALCSVYVEKNFRHSYYSLSAALEKFSPDERDCLSSHLREIEGNATEYLEAQYPGDTLQQENILLKIAKLCDHVDLETLRLSRIEKAEYIGRSVHEAVTATDGKLSAVKDLADELDNRVTSYHEHSITILGIFAGIVVAFSGVVQLTSTGITEIANATAFKITFFVCLSFFLLFNIIFLLLYCIAKISGSSIASNCKKSVCQNCGTCKTFLCRLKTKYPYVFWFDVLGSVFCAILCYIATVK